MEENKPNKTYRIGLLSLSMWENETEEGRMRSFSIRKSYKDEKDEWQTTNTLKVSDLQKLALLLEEAYKDNMVSIEQK